MTALALWGCDGPPPTPNGDVFPERDKVCADGATQPCATTENAHTDADRTAEPGTGLDGATLTYVVDVLSIPEAVDGRAPGFNLDELDSGEGDLDGATCEEYQPDFVSTIDQDHVGVDNALQGLVSTIEGFLPREDCPMMETNGCLDATLQGQINEGSVLLMVQLTGVDSLDYDLDVTMQLFLVQVPGGGAPELTPGEMGDPSRRLVADQAFEDVQALGDPVQGDIFDGRVRAAADLLTLQINVGDIMIALPISNPEVRFDIAEDGLSNGVIGGVVTVQDIVDVAVDIGGVEEGTVRPVIEMFSDVTPSAADPNTCDALSVGIQFGATTGTH